MWTDPQLRFCSIGEIKSCVALLPSLCHQRLSRLNIKQPSRGLSAMRGLISNVMCLIKTFMSLRIAPACKYFHIFMKFQVEFGSIGYFQPPPMVCMQTPTARGRRTCSRKNHQVPRTDGRATYFRCAWSLRCKLP